MSEDTETMAQKVAVMMATVPEAQRPAVLEQWHTHCAELALPLIISGMARELRTKVVAMWAYCLSNDTLPGFENPELAALRWLWNTLPEIVAEPESWFWIIRLRMQEMGAAETWMERP